MKVEVGLFEAKNKLAELVRRAERGEEIIITRHGTPAARLVPPLPKYDIDQALAAVERIRARRKRMQVESFDWEGEWKVCRDEGRE